MSMKWSKGDKVMAKWPGSGLYYKAEVLSFENDVAEVLYEDGTQMEIGSKFVKSEGSFKQRKRSKSSGGSRRRSRSPARSPSRRGRADKKTEETPKTSRSMSRGRRAAKSKSSPEKGDAVSQEVKKSPVKQTRTVYEKTTVSSATTDSRYMTRQRVKTTTVIQQSQTSTSSSSKDEDVQLEYGGVLGAFLMYITTPLISLFLLLVSTKANWSISEFNRKMIPTKFDDYINKNAFFMVIGFLAFHALIYALPFGHIISGPATVNGKRLPYRIGAPYTFFFTSLAFGSMCYYKIPFIQVHDQLFHLAVASIIISFIGCWTLYIASFWAPKYEINPAGNTGSILYDSFIGRLMHPRIGKLFDLKLYLYRPCMAGWLVMVWIELYRAIKSSGGNPSHTLLMLTASQTFYVIMVFFYDENQCPYMFDIKNESLGFPQFIGELTVVPFLYSMSVRYLIDHPTKTTIPVVVAFVAFSALGYYFVLMAGRQKSMYRMDPYDQRVSGFESILPSTPGGDRLLISGVWGVCRCPQYLGEIFIALSWSVICGFSHFLAWYYPIMVTVLLCQRSFRVEARNIKKHGHSWKIYCEKVPFRVLPGVF